MRVMSIVMINELATSQCLKKSSFVFFSRTSAIYSAQREKTPPAFLLELDRIQSRDFENPDSSFDLRIDMEKSLICHPELLKFGRKLRENSRWIHSYPVICQTCRNDESVERNSCCLDLKFLSSYKSSAASSVSPKPTPGLRSNSCLCASSASIFCT